MKKWIVDRLYKDYPNKSMWVSRYIKILEYKDTNNKNTDKHHILPRSLYPEFIDCVDNIIQISAKQHYLCHYILFKITECFKMGYAFKLMVGSKK